MSSTNDDLKSIALSLRQRGKSIIAIAKQLGVAKSTVSLWTNKVVLSAEQKKELLARKVTTARAQAHSNVFRVRRQACQIKGREKIKIGEPLYVAGCMLYWGEGTKNKHRASIVNSELPMLQMFKNFLEKYFQISPENIAIDINAYTDLRSKEEIISYWLSGLQLPENCLKQTLWNQYPSSSKKKSTKCEYGTCTLRVNKTEVVQEIFGAIQEFGKFENKKWLG